MYNCIYTRFNLSGSTEPLSYRFIFAAVRVPVTNSPPTQLTVNNILSSIPIPLITNEGG